MIGITEFMESNRYDRELRETDVNRVADMWFETDLKAHRFISARYRKSNFEAVKEMQLQSEAYVYEKSQKIQGFIGVNGNTLKAFLFVRAKGQNCF